MRIIYSDRRGSHGWGTPDPDLPFDVNTFATFQAAWFVASRGTELLDDPCMEAGDCPYFRPEPDPDLP